MAHDYTFLEVLIQISNALFTTINGLFIYSPLWNSNFLTIYITSSLESVLGNPFTFNTLVLNANDICNKQRTT